MKFVKNFFKTFICFKCQSAYVPKCIQVHKRSPFGSAANFCLTFGVAVAVANENVSRSRSLRDFDKNAAIRGHYHVPHQRRCCCCRCRLTPKSLNSRSIVSISSSVSVANSGATISISIFIYDLPANSSCPNSNSWAKRRLTTNLRIWQGDMRVVPWASGWLAHRFSRSWPSVKDCQLKTENWNWRLATGRRCQRLAAGIAMCVAFPSHPIPSTDELFRIPIQPTGWDWLLAAINARLGPWHVYVV